VSVDAKSVLEARLAALAAGPAAAIRLGLDGVRQVAAAMGLPMDIHSEVRLACPVVVVAGTNGKGSTCAMLASIAQQAGYRISVYSSPHLLTFEERLTVDGVPVCADRWVEALDRVAQAQASIQLEQGLTFFEVITLAAIGLAHQTPLDLAIFEIGLGGRLDAVNVLANDASVLTSVDLDHQAYLGNTREDIGFEKAHVARAGRPFIVADPLPPASVLTVAKDRGADLWRFGEDFNYQGDRQQWSWVGRGQRRNAMAYPALRGANQLLNASAALSVFAALRHQLPISQQAVRQGLSMVSLPGRFQVLPGQPAVVLDVAHNPHAAAVLATNLDQMGFFPQTIAVLGLLSDKDVHGVLTKLIGRVDHWCLTDLDARETGGRARSAESIAQVLREVQQVLPDGGRAGMGPATISCHPNPEQAIVHAGSLADPSDRILVFGSFHTVASGWQAAHRLGQAPHAPTAH
jgi:dihydrofolate synthase/folylpolyglutamate synthase